MAAFQAFEGTLSRPPIAEGKTKWVFQVVNDPRMVLLVSKDDITAGDGAKHDVMVGKAELANRTTCNVFRLLKMCGIPVAFEESVDRRLSFGDDNGGHGFVALRCAMLPYEVVVRREAHGSYLKRAPHLSKGHVFPRLIVEFFLKTSGKKWKKHQLACDDPLMVHDDGQWGDLSLRPQAAESRSISSTSIPSIAGR